MKQFEAYGVTTVMSLGLNGPLFYELRPELHAGRVPGADLFGADRGVGVIGGQPSAAVVPVADNQVSRPDGEEAARLAVREMAARKADLVKIWLDDASGAFKVKVQVGAGDGRRFTEWCGAVVEEWRRFEACRAAVGVVEEWSWRQ